MYTFSIHTYTYYKCIIGLHIDIHLPLDNEMLLLPYAAVSPAQLKVYIRAAMPFDVPFMH